MKAEKNLKVWSIITLVISGLAICMLFVALFKEAGVSVVLADLYEEYTNEIVTNPKAVYSLCMKIGVAGLTFILVVNQVLMWVSFYIIKKNYNKNNTKKDCRKEANHHEERKSSKRIEKEEETLRTKN